MPDIDSAARLVLSGSINPTAFSITCGNPSPATVKAIFDNLGFSDVFGTIRSEFETRWGRPEAHTFISDKLSEIVNRRQVVAHTANALNIGRSDLRQAVRFLRILAEILDKHINKYISEIIDAHSTS